jgi:hypothetical protein
MPLGKLRQDYHPLPSHRQYLGRGIDVSGGRPTIRLHQPLPGHPAEDRADRWRPGRAFGVVLSISIALWMAILLVASHLSNVA